RRPGGPAAPGRLAWATPGSIAGGTGRGGTVAERLDVPGEWQRVSMRYALVDSIGNVIGWAVLGIGVTVPIWFANDQQLPMPWGWIPIAAAIVLSIVSAVWAFLRTRTIGYLQRADDLLV